MLRRTAQVFLSHPEIDICLVVINPDHRELYDEAVANLPLPEPVAGGTTRQESVRLGLAALSMMGHSIKDVLIHDAARPLVDHAIIDGVLSALKDAPAAIAAKPVTDTLKRAAKDGLITDTVSREQLWQAQTPQGFDFSSIHAAHQRYAGLALTDDAAVAEKAGMPVKIVAASPDNMKITQPDDMERAERLLGLNMPDIRTGFGFDVHRLIPGTEIVLCGVRIPHHQRLEGHSDADVALHALTDAIYSALGDGDIGVHFPNTDPQWRGVDSAVFLKHAVGRLKARQGVLAHVDVTLLCEQPRVNPHRMAMRERLSELLGITLDRVSVKATTTEKLGFTGREEGIAAQAVATVRLPQAA